MIIDITTQQLLYNLSPTSTIREIHPSQQYYYFGIGVGRFDSIQLHNGTIIINFIDAITIGGLDPVTLSVPLVSCRGSCVTPCRPPGASKHNPTIKHIQVKIGNGQLYLNVLFYLLSSFIMSSSSGREIVLIPVGPTSSLQLERSSPSRISSILFP